MIQINIKKVSKSGPLLKMKFRIVPQWLFWPDSSHNLAHPPVTALAIAARIPPCSRPSITGAKTLFLA
jgi:hypothetical protein